MTNQPTQIMHLNFKTQHKSKVCDETMLSIWSSSVWFSDQPHGDLSFLPTFEVSKLASKYVKVVLTGDGADELFLAIQNTLIFSENYLQIQSMTFKPSNQSYKPC